MDGGSGISGGIQRKLEAYNHVLDQEMASLTQGGGIGGCGVLNNGAANNKRRQQQFLNHCTFILLLFLLLISYYNLHLRDIGRFAINFATATRRRAMAGVVD